MKKAVAYIRVSTDGQVDRYGLDAQLHDITEYAKAYNIEIVEVFREEGISGAKDKEERIEFVRMLDYIELHPEVKCVIIPALDRLARDVMIQENMIRDFHKRGLELISVREPDLGKNDSFRKMIRQIFGAINEYEREMITARMKAGRLAKARKGGHAIGRVPTGFKSVVKGNKKVLEKVEEEIEVVKLIFHLKDNRKMSYRKIVDYLNSHGYKPRYADKFCYSSVHKIYNNPKYRGMVEHHEGEEKIKAESEVFKIV